MKIFNDTGVFPAPPITIFPIQIIASLDFFSLLIKLRIFVPSLKINEKEYNEFERRV